MLLILTVSGRRESLPLCHATKPQQRALLEAVLLRPRRKCFAEALAAIPNVGRDEDFERTEDRMSAKNVFD